MRAWWTAWRQRYLGTVRKVLEVVVTLLLGATSGMHLATGSVATMLTWQVTAIIYIVFQVAWPMRSDDRGGLYNRWLTWTWLLPLLAATIGMSSAFSALLLGSEIGKDLAVSAVAALASFGVILSWLLVHAGFADLYEVLDRGSGGRDLGFPGDEDDSSLSYLYFAVTIGTSFATSDVAVLSRRARQLVIIHSVVSFCYNALTVAVAFQVLQKVVVA